MIQSVIITHNDFFEEIMVGRTMFPGGKVAKITRTVEDFGICYAAFNDKNECMWRAEGIPIKVLYFKA